MKDTCLLNTKKAAEATLLDPQNIQKLSVACLVSTYAAEQHQHEADNRNGHKETRTSTWQ